MILKEITKLAIKYYELASSKDSKVTGGMPWLKRFLKIYNLSLQV